MTILKFNRKAMSNKQVFVNSSNKQPLLTMAELERFTPVLLKVAKKLVTR